MSEIKTWDEVEGLIAHQITGTCGATCCHVTGGTTKPSEAKYNLPLSDAGCECREVARSIGRALRAAGLAIVPREATDAMIEAAVKGSNCCELCGLKAALTAGEIKPEGE